MSIIYYVTVVSTCLYVYGMDGMDEHVPAIYENKIS